MPARAAYRFLDPALLAALGDASLVARRPVDGFMYGAQASRLAGAGVEFSQYRAYQPGDDLRRLDWKLLARADRLFVREAEIETSATLRLVLDASASMGYAEDGRSLFDHARLVAGTLAALAERHGDAVGLVAVRDGAAAAVRPARGRRHLHRILHELETIEPRGRWPAWDGIEATLAATEGRGLVVVLSDLHERTDELRVAVRRLAALRQEVAVVHVEGGTERDFAWHGAVRFVELETGRTVDVDADRARAEYVRRREARLDDLRRTLAELGASYLRLALDRAPAPALRAWLARRGAA